MPTAARRRRPCRRRLHRLFELLDSDGDAHISFRELALALRKFRPVLDAGQVRPPLPAPLLSLAAVQPSSAP
jgi:Ca2+-binding EF-hand superfamily protein